MRAHKRAAFSDKQKYQKLHKENKAQGYRCTHCRQWVSIHDFVGSRHRNHCNWCLWSKHVDQSTGDRRATCHGGMQPIALTLKHEGYGRYGEIMLVHMCCACSKISINRILRDDMESEILTVFENSNSGQNQDLNWQLRKQGIDVLCDNDADLVTFQLYGR